MMRGKPKFLAFLMLRQGGGGYSKSWRYGTGGGWGERLWGYGLWGPLLCSQTSLAAFQYLSCHTDHTPPPTTRGKTWDPVVRGAVLDN